jgi:hypothetical protein
MSDTPTPNSAPTAVPAREVISDPALIREHLALLAEAAQHDVVVFAPQLDARLFNAGRLTTALAHFVAGHRQRRVRFLVEDGAHALRDNGRVVDLCRRLSDFVALRQVGEAHRGLREVFVVADRRAYLHQEDIAKPTCVIDPAGRRVALDLATRFEAMWEQSETIEGLRTAGL